MTKFVLVLNSKKAELAKLKQQIEQSTTENGSNKSLPIHSEYPTNKRTRQEISDADTSEDEIEKPTQSKLKILNNNQDSSLDLGNDQMDYKTSTTISKHHQRRKYITDTNSISTRPFIHHTSSIVSTPSLPDDSLTTDDLLNKI